MSIYLRNITRFILLILIQTLLLNKIPLRWWAAPGIPPYTPFVYPLFLLLLPISTPVWFMLISGFFLGLTMDAFMDTGGVHAAACVLTAASRKWALSLLLPKRLSEYKSVAPNVKNMGWSPFLAFAAILLLIHHTAYYLLEIWSLASPGYLLLKVSMSLVTSMVFVVIYALLFSKSINTNYFD